VNSDSSYSFQFNEMARPARLELATPCLEDRESGPILCFTEFNKPIQTLRFRVASPSAVLLELNQFYPVLPPKGERG
jgi:hypothetical protein